MRKRIFITTLLTILLVLPLQSIHAGRIQTLAWEDLIPAGLKSYDPFEGLTDEQRSTGLWMIYMLENIPERNAESEEIYQMIDGALSELETAGIDVKSIIQKKKVLNTSVVTALNAREVSIPGYLLPLEISDTKVTEFLLVPYFGACIHAPPPPPNQILHGIITSKKGYKPGTLWDPVMVTGVLSVESLVKKLFLVDGSEDINIGYKIRANKIKPYKSKNGDFSQ